MSRNAVQREFLNRAAQQQARESHHQRILSGELVRVPGTDACMTADSYREFVAELHDQGLVIKRNPLAHADAVMTLSEIVTPTGAIDNSSMHAVALIDFRARKLRAEARQAFTGVETQSDSQELTADFVVEQDQPVTQPAPLELA